MRFRLFAILVVAICCGCQRSEPAAVGADASGKLDPLRGPPALNVPESVRSSPAGWPFDESFPHTSGTGRYAGGAFFWSSFLYDDHGAIGALVGEPAIVFSPPTGTYVYPSGAAANNGADIAAAAVGMRGDAIWFRVDWQTLADPSIPAALWAFDTDDDAASGVSSWPAGAAVSSAGVELWLLNTNRGAWLIDGTGKRASVADLGGEQWVDSGTGSFVVRVPKSALPTLGAWKVRLASGLANVTGDAIAPVTVDHGALPVEPALYDVAFRADAQEPVGRDNWWRDKALALALTQGDISDFSVEIAWADLAQQKATAEPDIRGWTNRWYYSSIDLGPGIVANKQSVPVFPNYASDFLPNYLGRRQPYGIYVPSELGDATPLTVLLHSINVSHNQFAVWNPSFVENLCEGRKSICISPLGRGADGWWADEAELDMWEVWNRVASSYEMDPARSVLLGYSMGGYGTYRLGLEHPDLFAAILVLAGAPACSVRVVQGVEGAAVSGNRECESESDTSPLVENARYVPFYIGHDSLDELAPVSSAVQQAGFFDALGYRYRLEIYSKEDHVVWSNTGTFEGALAWLTREDRQVASAPSHITYNWYSQHQRPDLGTGPGSVWWISGLKASSDEPGFKARVDAVSHALPEGAPAVQKATEPLVNSDGPAVATELTWGPPQEPAPARVAAMEADFRGVADATVDLQGAGFAPDEKSVISVTTDGPLRATLRPLHGTVRTSHGNAYTPDAAGAITIPLEPGQTLLTICTVAGC